LHTEHYSKEGGEITARVNTSRSSVKGGGKGKGRRYIRKEYIRSEKRNPTNIWG